MKTLELLCYVISMLVFLGLASANLSDEEKEEIVRAHNFYRGKVDPIATNMEQMVIYYASMLLRSMSHLRG